MPHQMLYAVHVTFKATTYSQLMNKISFEKAGIHLLQEAMKKSVEQEFKQWHEKYVYAGEITELFSYIWEKCREFSIRIA